MDRDEAYDQMDALLEVAIDSVSERYKDGCIEYTIRTNKPLWSRIRKIEDRLTAIMNEENPTSVFLAEFKAQLRKWWGLYVEAIKLYEANSLKKSI